MRFPIKPKKKKRGEQYLPLRSASGGKILPQTWGLQGGWVAWKGKLYRGMLEVIAFCTHYSPTMSYPFEVLPEPSGMYLEKRCPAGKPKQKKKQVFFFFLFRDCFPSGILLIAVASISHSYYPQGPWKLDQSAGGVELITLLSIIVSSPLASNGPLSDNPPKKALKLLTVDDPLWLSDIRIAPFTIAWAFCRRRRTCLFICSFQRRRNNIYKRLVSTRRKGWQKVDSKRQEYLVGLKYGTVACQWK